MVPYLARFLTVTEYGVYGQVLLIIGLIQVLFSFGMSKIIYNFLSENIDISDIKIRNFFSGVFFLGILAFVISFFGAKYFESFFETKNLSICIKIYSLSLVFNLLNESLSSLLVYYEKIKQSTLVTILSNLLRVIFIFIGVQIYNSLEAVFYGLLIGSIITFILYVKISPKSLSIGWISYKSIFKLYKLGLPLTLSGITTVLLVQTDGVMVSKMLSTEDYAIFRMGAIPIPFLFIIYSSVITITHPEVTKLFFNSKIDQLIALKRKSSLMLSFVIYPMLVFILIFSNDLISIYLGDKYSQSQSVFVIYNILLFLRVNDYRDILIAKKQTKIILKCDLFVFGLNVILNFLLIKYAGLIGAAISSIISYYILSMLLLYFTSKSLKIRMMEFFDFKRIASILISSLSVCFGFYLIYSYLGCLYLLFPFMLIYFFTVYFFILKLRIIKIYIITDYTSQIKLLKPLDWLVKKV